MGVLEHEQHNRRRVVERWKMVEERFKRVEKGLRWWKRDFRGWKKMEKKVDGRVGEQKTFATTNSNEGNQ